MQLQQDFYWTPILILTTLIRKLSPGICLEALFLMDYTAEWELERTGTKGVEVVGFYVQMGKENYVTTVYMTDKKISWWGDVMVPQFHAQLMQDDEHTRNNW